MEGRVRLELSSVNCQLTTVSFFTVYFVSGTALEAKWQSQRIIQIITKTVKLTEMVSKSRLRAGMNPLLVWTLNS
ncbi:jg16018 [Pararge aegeria aegeria]|uniref:Jg16018 protein n=1 Tax=Pararge aegeria aegeria TaxID=348720 RepID=A0A8S4SR89_9NEOP|nr:jg16018 [Pararge aegeria aegeria]